MSAIESFFAPYPDAARIYRAIEKKVLRLDGVTIKAGKSQIGFSRAHPFAAIWVPEQYLRRPEAPLVLSIFLRRRDTSRRWKEVVEPAPGRFTHHLELTRAADVDDEVAGWLNAAWREAG